MYNKGHDEGKKVIDLGVIWKGSTMHANYEVFISSISDVIEMVKIDNTANGVQKNIPLPFYIICQEM